MKKILKFGGGVLLNPECVKRAAKIIAAEKASGNNLLVVVSAMGTTTRYLLNGALQYTNNPKKSALDLLYSTGETAAAACMEITLDSMGIAAQSFTAGRLGIISNDNFGDAEIIRIESDISYLMQQEYIPIVTGFQGITESGLITTFGFDGSDYSASAMAAAAKADVCCFYKDVPGVYEQDPKKYPGVKKLDFITYDDMLKLVDNGANVLHRRSIILARDHNIPLEIRDIKHPDIVGTLIGRQR